MGEEHFNLLISQSTELNTNKFVHIDLENMLSSNKRVNPETEPQYKAFFYNDIDLVSTSGEKLATLTNNIVVVVRTRDIDGKPLCFAHYFYKVTCHGWASKVPIHLTFTNPDGEKMKKVTLREIEIYSGCKDMQDSRIEYIDHKLFEPLLNMQRAGDNSRWIKC